MENRSLSHHPVVLVKRYISGRKGVQGTALIKIRRKEDQGKKERKKREKPNHVISLYRDVNASPKKRKKGATLP